MKKLGLILAGAALFDLGTVVASGHAADSKDHKQFKVEASGVAPTKDFKHEKAGEPSGLFLKHTKAEASGIPTKHVGTTSGDTAPEAPAKK